MQTKTYTVYEFDELSPKQQAMAIDRYQDINVDYDWWRWTYDGAAEMGIKINHFDCDRSWDIGISITGTHRETAMAILTNHGPGCDTWKTARDFMLTVHQLKQQHRQDEIEDAQQEFEHSLGQDYLTLLRDEAEYLMSDEAIIETFKANEYQFTADGRID